MDSQKANTTMMVQPLWKIADVARYLGIPTGSVYSMTGPSAALRIPHLRIAGKVRFRKEDIDLWLNQYVVTTGGLLKNVPAEATETFNRN